MPEFTLPAIGTAAGFAWDKIVLATSAIGTITFPPGGAGEDVPADRVHGKVVVHGAKIGRDLGVHKTSGKDGGRIIDKGFKPAEIKIRLIAWDTIGLDTLAALMAAIEPRKRIKDRAAIGVQYPSLAQLGITSIVVESVTGLEPTEPHGCFVMELDCKEFTAEGPAKRRNNVTHQVTQTLQVPSVYVPYNQANRSPRENAFNRTPSSEVTP